MYKFEDIRDVHLEITSKWPSKCPNVSETDNVGPMNSFIKLDDIHIIDLRNGFQDNSYNN